jgi:hypothetical protein
LGLAERGTGAADDLEHQLRQLQFLGRLVQDDETIGPPNRPKTRLA